jgi:hypothetical protein
MTSPRKRLANKANASKSTGPKTAAGMRAASLNATTHGLSVATDPDSLDPTAERVAALIASGGIDQDLARGLAAKIIDYERCMEHQRALLAQESTPPMSQEQHGQRHQSLLGQMFGKELSMIDDVLEEQEFLSGRVLKSELNFRLRMKFKMDKLVAKVQAKSDRLSQQQAKKHESSAARHYKRATNQLFKGLKALG